MDSAVLEPELSSVLEPEKDLSGVLEPEPQTESLKDSLLNGQEWLDTAKEFLPSSIVRRIAGVPKDTPFIPDAITKPLTGAVKYAVQRADAFIGGGPQEQNAAGGLAEGATNTALGFANPDALAGGTAIKAGGVIGQAAKAAFAAQMASQAPAAYDKLKQAAKHGDEEDIAKAVVEVAADTGLPLEIVKAEAFPDIKSSQKVDSVQDYPRATGALIPQPKTPATPLTKATLNEPTSPVQGPPPVTRPVVPETPPEPWKGVSVTEEIRQRNLRTKAQIKEAFPRSQLTNEQAARLRDAAWGNPPIQKPEMAVLEEEPPQTQNIGETQNANSQNVNEVPVVQVGSQSGQVIPENPDESQGVQRGRVGNDETKENVNETVRPNDNPNVGTVRPVEVEGGADADKGKIQPEATPVPKVEPKTNANPQSPTSTKNAIVDQERVKRGLPPAIEPERRSRPEVWDRVMGKIDSDPQWQDNLISELRDNPRAVTDEENDALLQRQVTLHNSYGELTRKLSDLHEKGETQSIPENRARLAAVSDQLLDLYNINKRVGTETGRGLNARKMMANEDFSLAQMELGKRAANDGRPLTDDERTQLTKLHDEIKGWQEKYDAHVSASRDKEANLQTQLEVERIKNESKPVAPHIKIIADKIKDTFDKRASAALKRLQGKTFALGPEQLADLADLGASKILSGLADFTGWSAEMVRDFGETIKPHLQAVFDAANKAISKELGSTGLETARAAQEAIKNLSPEQQIQRISGIVGEKLKAGKKDSVTTYVQKLARLIVAGNPAIDRDGLIDRVHEIVSSVQPGITRSEARDMISGYGDFKQLSKDVISTRLRDLKGQMQQVDKFEAMQKGEPPKKSGVERRTPSREESLLIRQVNDAKREFQVPIDDPNTQLKSSLDTLKTRMQTRILDYEKKLAEKDFTTKPKREIKLDSEALRLKSEAERAKQKYLNGLAADRLKKRTPLEKASDTLVKWSRGFLLSGPSTLAKLLSAAAWRLTINPIEEGIGSGLKRLPYVKEVAAHAPIEGRGLNLKTEAKALTEGFMKGLQDSVQTVKTGKSVLDNLFGGRRDVGYGEEDESQKSFIDFFGHLHGAIKAPVKRAAFTRAFENQTEFYMSKGVDVSDPMIQTKMAVEAYKRANKDIFMQPNRYADRVRRFVTSLEEKDKVNGKTPALSKLASTAFKVAVPIVKVPTNIIAETLTYATGLFSGSYHLKQATDILRKGAEELKPEQADLVLRELKKGSIGTAALLIGYFAPQVFGGFYQRGQKRKQSDAPYEGAKIQGYNIPRNVAHFPLVEAAQTGATVAKVAESRPKKGSVMQMKPAGLKQGFSEGVLAAGLGLADEVPFIGNVMEMSKAFNPQERQQYLGELLKSRLEPQLISQIAEHYDKDAQGNPIKRKPHTITQSLESGIPGLRKNVPVR